MGVILTTNWDDPPSSGYSDDVQADLQNVAKIQSNYEAFAALKRDGSVVTWGNPTYGGDSRRVQRKLRGDFRAIKKSGFYGENQRGGIGNDGPRLC